MDRIPALTSIRGIAALLVFVGHYTTMAGRHHFGAKPGQDPVWRLLAQGGSGVTVFFALSGFLLVGRYLDTPWGLREFGRYWLRRAARILPLYWVLCTIYLVSPLWTGWPWEPFGAWPIFYTLTQGFFVDLKFGNIGVAWSLTVEESFYVILLPLVSALGLAWRAHSSFLRGAMGGALVLGLFAITLYQLGRALGDQHWITSWGFFAGRGQWRAYTICGRFLDFACGALLALIFRRTRNRLLNRRWLPDVGIIVAAVLFVVVAAMAPREGIVGSAGWRANMVLAALSACVIYLCCVPRGCFTKVLAWRPFVYVGEISYAFYLVHHDLIYPLASALPWLATCPFVVGCAVTYLASSLVAAGCFELIERPCRRWLLARLDRPIAA